MHINTHTIIFITLILIGIPGLFTGTHVFEIVQREKDVLFIQREQFRGLFVWFAELDSIEEGYDLMNRALKARAENSTIP